MKVTYNWLKDFVDIKISPEKLAYKLTMAGLEVTSLEKSGDDWIFEMEITSNRPDWFSVAGIAREAAAITNKKLRLPQFRKIPNPIVCILQPASVKVQDRKACPLYTARLITGVSIKSSPAWMQKRLLAVGLRPINNIVDITNYVLMETGQPLHAFDFDKLVGKTIIIRRAKEGEKIITIKGAEQNLDSSILVIADNKRPVAIAGIMGGVDTEVNQNTKNILLESACFDPIITRRVSRKLALFSESSYRFERNVDLSGVSKASDRACDLICQLTGGSAQDFKSQPAKIKSQKDKITVYTNQINKTLDTKISPAKIKIILTHLGFGIKLQAKGKIAISIPSYRPDVKQEADIIEEVARCIGYDNLPSTLPSVKVQDIKIENAEIIPTIRDILIKLGLNEVITLSLINRNLLEWINFSLEKVISVRNPLSQDQEILRPTLIPSMLSCIAGNINRNVKDISIFEISHIFNSINEPVSIAIVLTGDKLSSWQDKDKRKLGFFDLKGIVETLLKELGIKKYSIASGNLMINNNLVGRLEEIEGSVLDKWDIPRRGVFIAELCLDKLIPFIKLIKKYTPLNKFPKVSRNLSIVIPQKLTFAEIEKCINKNTSGLLKEIGLAEQYKGEHIEKGSSGLNLLLEYQADDHTLTDEEVNSAHSAICNSLVEQFKVKIR